jgi:hypothetical protein
MTMVDKQFARTVVPSDSIHYRWNAQRLGLEDRAPVKVTFKAIEEGQRWEEYRLPKRTLVVTDKLNGKDPRIALEDIDTGRKTTIALRQLMVRFMLLTD